MSLKQCLHFLPQIVFVCAFIGTVEMLQVDNVTQLESTKTSPFNKSVTTANVITHENTTNMTEYEVTTKMKRIECVCQSEYPSDCGGKDICIAFYSCFSVVGRSENGEGSVIQKGCLNYESPAFMMCKLSQNDELNMQCCDTNMCNKDIDPVLTVTDVVPNDSNSKVSISVLIPLGVLFPLVISFIAVFICWKNHRKRMQKLEERPMKSRHFEGGLHVQAVGESTLWNMMTSPSSSGSGSGLPFLVHRTVARQIHLADRIGKGRYGEVWRGIYQGESVAVKIFSSRDEESFNRETDIYNTVMLRHANVLCYYASDRLSRNSCTELWLICSYHPYGSLYEYLQRATLDQRTMINLCKTAALGLSHLHSDITGVKGKPPIAHRDVKTKNILVKTDLTSCIADLGLAVLLKDDNSVDICKNNYRVGTKRYMAPEVLDETLNVKNFDSFRQADVYAFSLVLWEVCRRGLIGGIAEEYKPPFHDVVGHDPSFEEMRKIVCDCNHRPVIPNRWQTDQNMNIIVKLMKEMWTSNAASRLTMLRVKKTLSKALDSIEVKKYPKAGFCEKELLIPRSDKVDDSAYAPNLLKQSDENIA
ncbi:activin receptor type-1-like [Styela clava]